MQRFGPQPLRRLTGRLCDHPLTLRLAVSAVAVLSVIGIALNLEKPEPRHLAYAIEAEADHPPFIVPQTDEGEASPQSMPLHAELAARSFAAIAGLDYMPLNRSAGLDDETAPAAAITAAAAVPETTALLIPAEPADPVPALTETVLPQPQPVMADAAVPGSDAGLPLTEAVTLPEEEQQLPPGAAPEVPETAATLPEPTTTADPDARLIGRTLYVRAYDVPVYDAASTAAGEVAIVQRGTAVELEGFEADFAAVGLEDGRSGYLQRSLLQEDFIFPMWVRTLYCTVDGVDAREAADPDLPPVHRFNSGDEVLVIGRTDDWFEVQRPNGYLMYCRNWHFSETRPTEPTTTAAPTTAAPAPAPTAAAPQPAPTTAAPTTAAPTTAAATAGSIGQRIVDIALSMRGPQGGYDCSAFVQEVYRRAGISIPRSTYGYAGTGQNRSLATAEPGDLILFDSLGVGHTTHVGIYLGGSEVIHVNTVQHKIMIQDWRPSAYPITGVKRYR